MGKQRAKVVIILKFTRNFCRGISDCRTLSFAHKQKFHRKVYESSCDSRLRGNDRPLINR
jgi:hypothetical protein